MTNHAWGPLLIPFFGAAVIALIVSYDEIENFGEPEFDELSWAEKAKTDLSRTRSEAVVACKQEVEGYRRDASVQQQAREAARDAMGSSVSVYKQDYLRVCMKVASEISSAGIGDLVDPRTENGVPSNFDQGRF